MVNQQKGARDLRLLVDGFEDKQCVHLFPHDAKAIRGDQSLSPLCG